MRRVSLTSLLILLLAGTVQGATQDTLRPVADKYTGTGEWPDFPSAGARYLKIDDATSDDDATYLDEENDNDSYAYLTDDWSGSGDPDSVEAHFLIRKAAAFNTFQVAIGRAMAIEAVFTWCGAPDTVQEDSETYTMFKYMMLTDPCTDAAWTTASLNSNTYGWGIRYAFAGTAQVGRYTQGYVVVYSTEAAVERQVILLTGVSDEETYHNPRRGIPPAAWE